MSTMPYRRLPGKRRTLVSATSLFLGPDHILQVRSNRIGEEYQRFYFQDVQSIVLRKTAPIHYVWAAVIVLVALLAARISGDARWPLGILAAGVLFLWLRGPSCNVRLRTAVTSERLHSLHRLKTAERVLPIVREQVEGVQGRVVSVPENYASNVAPAPPPLPQDPGSTLLAPRRRDHVYLFAFIALEAVLIGVWLQWSNPVLQNAITIATLIEFLALIIVLVRQAQQRISTALRNMTYIATARWFVVHLVSTGLVYKSVIIDHVKTTLDPVTLVRGTLSYITLVSLLAVGLSGIWLSVRTADE
jgi:hypothetical protein